MQPKLKSEGKCIYCSQHIAKSQMNKHLGKHLIEKSGSTGKDPAYHVKIECGEMFLHVLIKGAATFKTLDTFLRSIWLDCCGHMSEFEGAGMSNKFQDVASPGDTYLYVYDMGSSTQLKVSVSGVYDIPMKEKIELLSRNEPLKIMCHVCHKKPAIAMCTIHMCESDEFMFCDTCTKKHEQECEDFSDYANMPVVNSPRMGVCGYMGGHIDKERDGVYAGK
ncbi:MAG: hypothetical protein HY840_03310 [Bacteroidetes bacterium]|nr:hypothetical protein [Bacteroidota bacterium]